MLRATYILAIVALALFRVTDARAVGGVIDSPGESVEVMQARYAIAISSAQTTRWASIQVEKFPGAMAWLLPIRPGARIDETSDAWFEALELATAPRVVAASCGSTPASPATRVEGLPDRVPTQRSVQSSVIDDTNALRAFASEWALELPVEIESRFEDLQSRGFALAAFVYAGPSGGGFTRTVRVVDDSFPVVPMMMTLGVKSPVRVTAFLIGPARARLGAGAEIEIDPARVSVANDSSSNYQSVRAERLLASNGASWVIEASDSDFFLTGARRSGGVEVTPPIVPTYDQRASSYGDSPSDPTLALRGLDPGKVWVTRAAGIVPPNRFGDDVAVTLAPGKSKSPFFLVPPSSATCPPAAGTPQPPAMTVVSPPSDPQPRTPEPRQDLPPQQGPVLVETTIVELPPEQPVVVSGSCDGSPQSQPPETSDDSCSHSDSSTDSSSDDGCDSSSDTSSDQTDDGCDSSSSDTSQDQSSGGCDGSSQDSGQSSGGGCDSSSGSSSSSSSSDCSLARRHGRRRSRTSLIVWSICAVLLPLRRVARRRSRVQGC